MQKIAKKYSHFLSISNFYSQRERKAAFAINGISVPNVDYPVVKNFLIRRLAQKISTTQTNSFGYRQRTKSVAQPYKVYQQTTCNLLRE